MEYRNSVSIRAATKSRGDACVLWEARNGLPSTAFVRPLERIGFESHLEWYERALSSPERSIMIGESGGEPVGYVRGDRRDGSLWVSIALLPDRRGEGFGSPLLAAFIDQLPTDFEVVAQIHHSNEPSKAIFARSGFSRTGFEGDYQIWALVPSE